MQKSFSLAHEYWKNPLQLYNFGSNVETRLMLSASVQNSSIS